MKVVTPVQFLLRFGLAAGLGGLAWTAAAANSVSVDMDLGTPGIQSTRAVTNGEWITVGLVLDVDASGVSSYGISAAFDNTELSLNGFPAATELLPAGLSFNLTAGVAFESGSPGAVYTFEAATLGTGPASTSLLIGTIAFQVVSANNDGLVDLTPGFFNTGVDGCFDNAGSSIAPTFNSGYVNLVPAPVVSVQPQSQAANVGSNVTFCVTASGSPPLSYQWRFNGVNVSGATNSCYTRTNAQTSDAGTYSVIITNSYNSVTSSVARLTLMRIGWFTVDGGGGTSTGGVVRISGTIGQPDAGGPMTNGPFSVSGGFWALPQAVQTVGAPTLTIVPAAPGFATVSWTPNTPGFLLQENLNLGTTNWVNSPSGATNPIVVPATVPKKFYRLFKP